MIVCPWSASTVPCLLYALVIRFAGRHPNVSGGGVRLHAHDVLVEDLCDARVVQLRKLAEATRGEGRGEKRILAFYTTDIPHVKSKNDDKNNSSRQTAANAPYVPLQ